MDIAFRLFAGISRSFRIKLIFSLSGVILLAFGVAGYLTYHNSLQLLEQEISKQYLRTNEEALAKLELNVREVQRISQAIVFSPIIENKIKRINTGASSDPYELYDDKKQIEEQIFQIKLDAPYITAMYLYDLNGNPSYFSFNKTSVNKLDAGIYRIIRSKISDTYGDLVWMSMPLPSSIEPSGYRQSVIAARWMKNSLLTTYGMLVIAIDESFFSNSLNGLLKDRSGEIYLFNQSDEILYSDFPLNSGGEIQLRNNTNDPWLVNDRLFVQSESQATSFRLVSGTSLQEIRLKNRDIARKIIYSGLISVLLSSVLIILSTGQLLRPLKELVQGLRKVRSGDFKTRIAVRTKDELAYIGDSFNAMAEQVGRLIKEVYMTQLSEREAELRAIQAQLNPHFLHNIFNEIYWKLYLRDEKETAALIKSVSDMLNYSLMPVRTLTTVREEIQHIRDYVKVQTELFETELETVIQVEEDAMNGFMMRFLLQPLVENVFVHAFRNKVSDKRVLIRARRLGEELEIEVTDNGCGIDRTAVSLLLDSGIEGPPFPRRTDGRECLGIRSVQRRIDLVYGSPYRLDIVSSPGNGTTVRLKLPFEQPKIGDVEDAKRQNHDC